MASSRSQERKLQTRGVQWLNMTLPHVMVIAVINEIPQTRSENEQEREREARANMIRMVLMKQMGLYPGAADLIILWDSGKLEIGFLETKDKAPQHKNQRDFQKRLESIGGRYRIWRSLPELEAICHEWGLVPAAPSPKGATPLNKKQLIFNMTHEQNMQWARERKEKIKND